MATRVVGLTASNQQTVTTDSGVAYATGDAIGAALTFVNMANQQQNTCTVQSLQLQDNSKAKVAIDIFLFRAAPTVTNNAAFTPTTAQMNDCLGVIPIGTGDYVDTANVSIATIKNIGLALKLGNGTAVAGSPIIPGLTSIIAVPVSRGAPTYTSTTALVLTLQTFVD